MAAAPQAQMAMCLGNHRVPLQAMCLLDADGAWKNYSMVNLGSRVSSCPTWLWSALDCNCRGKGVHKVPVQYKIPLFLEMVESLKRRRKKRKKGLFMDSQYQPLPSLLEVTVRNKKLKVLNNTKSLFVHLGDDDLQTMNWFLGQLWQDLQAPLEFPGDETHRLAPACVEVCPGRVEDPEGQQSLGDVGDLPGWLWQTASGAAPWLQCTSQAQDGVELEKPA